jgi:hypothetical protein
MDWPVDHEDGRCLETPFWASPSSPRASCQPTAALGAPQLPRRPRRHGFPRIFFGRTLEISGHRLSQRSMSVVARICPGCCCSAGSRSAVGRARTEPRTTERNARWRPARAHRPSLDGHARAIRSPGGGRGLAGRSVPVVEDQGLSARPTRSIALPPDGRVAIIVAADNDHGADSVVGVRDLSDDRASCSARRGAAPRPARA